MKPNKNQRIDWGCSARQITQAFWAIITYALMLSGIAWGSGYIGSENPFAAASAAVCASTWLHWMLYSSLERQSNS